MIVDSGASEHVFGDIQVLKEVGMIPYIHLELSDGQKMVARQSRRLCLLIGSDHVTMTWMYYESGININTISSSGPDEKGVTNIVKHRAYHLTDRRDGVKFGNLNKKNSDELFSAVTQSCQTQEDTHSSVGLDDNEAHRKLTTALIGSAASLWNHRLGHIDI